MNSKYANIRESDYNAVLRLLEDHPESDYWTNAKLADLSAAMKQALDRPAGRMWVTIYRQRWIETAEKLARPTARIYPPSVAVYIRAIKVRRRMLHSELSAQL